MFLLIILVQEVVVWILLYVQLSYFLVEAFQILRRKKRKKALFFDVYQVCVCAHISNLGNISIFTHIDSDGLELDIIF